eukprot:403334014
MKFYHIKQKDKAVSHLVKTKLQVQQREKDFHLFLAKHRDDRELHRAVEELRKIMPEGKFAHKYLGARGTNGEKSIFQVTKENATLQQSHFNERAQQDHDSDSETEYQQYVPQSVQDQAIRRVIMSSIAHQMMFNFNSLMPLNYNKIPVSSLSQEEKLQRNIQEYDELYHEIHPEMTNWVKALQEKKLLQSDFDEVAFEKHRQKLISKYIGVENRHFLGLLIGLGLGGLVAMSMALRKNKQNKSQKIITTPNDNLNQTDINTQEHHQYLSVVLSQSGLNNVFIGGATLLFTSLKLTKLRYAILGYSMVCWYSHKLQTQIKNCQDYDQKTAEYVEAKHIDKDYEAKLKLVQQIYQKNQNINFLTLSAGYGLVLASLSTAKLPFPLLKYIPHILIINGFQQLAMSYLSKQICSDNSQAQDQVKQHKEAFYFQRWSELSSVLVSLYISSLLQYYGIKYFGQQKILLSLYLIPIALAFYQCNKVIPRIQNDQKESHQIQDKLDLIAVTQIIKPLTLTGISWKISQFKGLFTHQHVEKASVSFDIEYFIDKIKTQILHTEQKIDNNQYQ